jgi:hypothetical protein
MELGGSQGNVPQTFIVVERYQVDLQILLGYCECFPSSAITNIPLCQYIYVNSMFFISFMKEL